MEFYDLDEYSERERVSLGVDNIRRCDEQILWLREDAPHLHRNQVRSGWVVHAAAQ